MCIQKIRVSKQLERLQAKDNADEIRTMLSSLGLGIHKEINNF